MALPDLVMVPMTASPSAGTPGSAPIVLPVHLVPTSIREDILEGKDVNWHPCSSQSMTWLTTNHMPGGDVSVVVKSRDPSLSRKLSATEFALAFGMFRDVLCSATLSRREERDLYLHAMTDLAYKYGGFAVYDHRSFFSQSSSETCPVQDKL